MHKQRAILLAIAGLWMAILVLVSVSGCSRDARLLPAGQGIPDREIVFTVNDRGVLGFIHPDGSGYVTRTVDLSSWSQFSLGGMLTEIERDVTWSPDGKYLAGRYSLTNKGSGPPVLISTEGKFLRCLDETSPPIGSERLWVATGTRVLTARFFSQPVQVILWDMATCKEVDTLYTGQQREGIQEVVLSTQGWLAVARGVEGTEGGTLVLDPDKKQRAALPRGGWPAWSKDGEWLAYTIYKDGLYIARKDGTSVRKLVDDSTITVSSWSPDGQWIVYRRVNFATTPGVDTIYKVNVATGEEHKLHDGGVSPNWRWNVPDSQK